MRISWNWARQYADLDITPQAAAEVLTSTGLEVSAVEPIEPVPGMLKGVLVGLVTKRVQHPNADRLSLCTVDIGTDEMLSIVCGASNVAEGQKVLVATVGTELHPVGGEPFTIKKAKIRGEESRGMICAEDELGIGPSHDGIMVLDANAEVGQSAETYLGLVADHALEIDLTPNRSDAISHIGVVRDLVAALNYRKEMSLALKWPDVSAFKVDQETLPIKVEVQDPIACPRYAGVSLTHLKVGPSPAWLQERLKNIGLKPINNVVDVTNFVQHELGQPLHAFDADKITDHKIIVRKLKADRPFIALDEKERKLDGEDLMITDPKGGLCMAGVFGGLHSGVSAGTTLVFLESAIFDPSHIRRTAKRHGLHTDASFRFERGVDPNIALIAIKRAALLLKEVAGARIASQISDHYPAPVAPRPVKLRYKMLDRMTSGQIAHRDVERLLPLLDINVVKVEKDGLQVTVPTYRTDVTREIDVIEEIMRIHGLDGIAIPRALTVPSVSDDAASLEKFRSAIAAHFMARGFHEIMNASLVNGDVATEQLSVPEKELVTMSNPLSNELNVLRPSMLFGGLSTTAYNRNRQMPDLRLFEMGRVYRLLKGKVQELECSALFLAGRRNAENWRSKDVNASLEDVKAECELLLHRLGIRQQLKTRPTERPGLTNAHELLVNGTVVANIGSVMPGLRRAFDVDQEVRFAELLVMPLFSLNNKTDLHLEEVSKYPSVRRDLSLLLDRQMRFEELRDLAFKAEERLLKDVGLFDVYEGSKVPAGKKSYALSFLLQDRERTLTDAQVDKAMERILKSFQQELGAELRG